MKCIVVDGAQTVVRREPPQWVIDFVANPYSDYLPFGSGYALMREGVVIDRWPDVEEGFWRDAGHGVEQWVTPR